MLENVQYEQKTKTSNNMATKSAKKKPAWNFVREWREARGQTETRQLKGRRKNRRVPSRREGLSVLK